MQDRLRDVSLASYSVSSRTIPVVTGIAAFFILTTAVAHLIYGAGTANLVGFERLFDVDAEANLPTWYAAALIHFTALIALTISKSDLENRIHWRAIAVLLLCMGIDEIVSLHNAPSRHLGNLIGFNEGIMMNAWVIPGAIVSLIVTISFSRFLVRQPRWLVIGLITASALYLIGALVLEMASTKVEFDTAGFQYDGDEFYSLKFELIAVGEEVFEYAGVILAMALFMRRARELKSSITLVF